MCFLVLLNINESDLKPDILAAKNYYGKQLENINIQENLE